MVITTNGSYILCHVRIKDLWRVRQRAAVHSSLVYFPRSMHPPGTPTFSSLSHFGDICEWMFYVHTFALLRDVTIRDPAEALRLLPCEYILLSPVTLPKL